MNPEAFFRIFLFLVMNPIHNEPAHFETYIQRGFLDNAPRKIIINSEYIEFEDKNRVDAENSKLYWKDFDGIRYGYERISGYYFYIGLKRKIYIKDVNSNQIKISLTSLYKIRSKRNHQKFSEILQAIFDSFLSNRLKSLIEAVKSGETITLAGVKVSQQQVEFNYKEKLANIDLLVLNIATYKSYFYIYSEAENEIGIRINYLDDWNSALLYSIIKNLLKK